VLYYVKVTKFVKLLKFGPILDFCVLYYVKAMKFGKLENLVIWKIFVCYTT